MNKRIKKKKEKQLANGTRLLKFFGVKPTQKNLKKFKKAHEKDKLN